MKKALIITYAYAHPHNVGGGIRVQKFVKYLPEFGWHPVVLTIPSQLPRTSQREESAEFFAAAPVIEINGHPIISSYTWLWRATRAAERIIEQKQIDVVLANCGPFVGSIIAVNAAKRCSLPCAADFRDAWSFHPYSRGTRFQSRIMESYVVRRIQLLITTSPATTEEYMARYPVLASRTRTLYNGFDEEDFPEESPPRFKEFTIAFAGTLRASWQYSVLFDALQRLPNRNIRLLLIGTIAPEILECAAHRGLSESLTSLGRMEQGDAIRQLSRAHMLLLLHGPTKMRCTPIAGKTFEYIRTGLPILAVLPEGNNAAFLREHASQAFVITDFSTSKVTDAIEKCFNNWAAGSLEVRRNPDWEASYNRREITRQLGGLLDSALMR